MKIETLYFDSSFNSFLRWQANMNRIHEFDDYRQAVFEEILDTECDTIKEYRRAAGRVAKRMVRVVISDNATDISSYAIHRNTDSEEPEDEVMARMIYHRRARKMA